MKTALATIAVCLLTTASYSQTLGSFFDDPLDNPDLFRFTSIEQNWRNSQGVCIDGQTCWSELSVSQIRERITPSLTSFRVYERIADETFILVTGRFKFGRGEYRIEQSYVRYTPEPCNPENPGLGQQWVGVGVRVVASIVSRRNSVNFSDLLSVGVSVDHRNVRGSIEVRSWGITSPNSSMNALLSTQSSEITREGIQEALAALSIGEALFEGGDDTILSPYTFGVVESTPGACTTG